MEFSVATLLAQFSHDKLVAGKVLEKKLDCQKEDEAQKLQIALDALEKIGVLTKELGKYRRVVSDELVEAKLRCSSKGFCFAIQDQDGADDIYIRESHLSSAWNGDRVLVKTIKEGTRRRSPEGEVALILDRANPSLLARIKRHQDGYRATPLDDRLLFEVDIQTNPEQNLEDAIDHLVHIEIIRYPLSSHPPLGIVTKVLGSDAEAAADTDLVCCKHDLPHTFTKDVEAAAYNFPKPAPSGKIAKAELKDRLDLRKQLTVTIDPGLFMEAEGTPWIESALTLGKTATGEWQLGIHIADVAHYVEEDSVLDREARKRGTAIYLGSFVLPIFPEAVVRRCSLLPGQERLTMSLLLTLDRTGQIQEFEIQPSVVKVDRQLSDREAQELLSNADSAPAHQKEVVQLLSDLFFTLSPVVKAQRLQRGGFDVVLETAPTPYKDDNRTGALIASNVFPIRSMLSELLVLAGMAVAKHIQGLALPGLYCVQTEPDLVELEDFIKLGQNLKLDLEPEFEEEIRPQDYQHFTQEIAQSTSPKVLAHFLKSTLKPRRYSTHPDFYFGLAYGNGYSQCISPGQRYADLTIQRLLHTLFAEGRDRRSTRSKQVVNLGSSNAHNELNWNVLPTAIQSQWETTIAELIPHLNDRDKIAQDAEEDLEGLQKAEQMKERTGEVFPGLITGVQSYGFFVEIEELLVEGLVHVSSLKDDWYEYR
ncbi:MAG: ribonuclease R, partial [Jaaginema sp. PMC 1079.18]|nr:ribonuclease R [Jaaginema sp. PMC 1079.18]